jgi:hypothetical protein
VAVSLLDDPHQIATLCGGKPVRSPVVEDQQLSFLDATEQAEEATVRMGQFKPLEEAGYSFVNHVDAITADRLCQGAAEAGFADATAAGDDQVALVGDPFAGEQVLEQRLVEAAARAVMNFFWTATRSSI